jgi:hypothetical protein
MAGCRLSSIFFLAVAKIAMVSPFCKWVLSLCMGLTVERKQKNKSKAL